MTRDNLWLAGVIRRATTVEECQLAVSVYLQEAASRRGDSAPGHTNGSSQEKSIRLVWSNTDEKTA